jgi:hypothetical protein
MALVRLVLYRLSSTNETVQNVLKDEFCVEWCGSGAFIAKNSNASWFSELVRSWHQFGQFCNDFRAVTKRFETPQNLSSGSNGVDQVRSL